MPFFNTLDNKLIHVYNTNNGNFVTSFGATGRGSGEIDLSYSSYKQDERVVQIITDHTSQNIKFYLDSIFAGVNYFTSTPLNRNPNSDIFSFKDTLLISDFDFRKKYNIPKSRIVNDFHHAKDAFLNIVVGNVLQNRFTEDPRNFYKNRTDYNKNVTKNIKKIFDNKILSNNGKKIIWDPSKDIEEIQNICQKNDCLVTRMSFCNLNGRFYNETKYKSEKNDPRSQGRFELKGNSLNPLSNTKRYGGYDSVNTAYFCVVEGEKKGKVIKQIEAVPTVIIQKYKNELEMDKKINQYICEQSGLHNAKIIFPKLNIQSTVLINSGKYVLAAKTGDQLVLHNANQWRTSTEETIYVKAIEKYLECKQSNKDIRFEEKDDKVIISKKSKEGNVEIALTKTENEWLYEKIKEKLSVKVYQGLALETTLLKTLAEKQELFKNLSVEKQTECLGGILKGFAPNATPADLTLLGGSKNAAKILINKNISDKNICLLEQSTTGLFEKVIRL